MQTTWFDQTEYLKTPPPYQEVDYPNFKLFYESICTKKKNILLYFEHLCSHLSINGIIPDDVYIGGTFLKKQQLSNCKLKVLAVFNNQTMYNSFLRIKQSPEMKKGAGVVDFYEGTVDTPNNKNMTNSLITQLQKQHDLKDPIKKVAVVKIPFDGVVA